MSDKPVPYPDNDDGLLEYGLWQLEKGMMTSQNINPATLDRLAQKDKRRQRVQFFIDPDIIGSSEYRAIYGCIADALEDYNESEHADVAKAMLNEFIDHAKAAKKRLKKLVKIDRLKSIKTEESDSL